MGEELSEFFREPTLEEAADIYEVFLGLLHKHNLSLNEVRRVAAHKREELGGFRNGTVLHKVLEVRPQTD
jgi:predicted house-cleaning noncanonical NTP pyrophosphatase (MazG superfamily)